MKFKLLPVCLGIIFSNFISAQTLSPTVIASSGGFYSNPSGMLSSTVGEMSMVATFSAGGTILTQGFQQPEDFNVSVKNIDNENSGIAVGPNPTGGTVQIIFSKPDVLKLSIAIYDVAGRLVYHTETQKAAFNNYVALNLASFVQGDYVLECKSKGISTGTEHLFSQKISVIK